MRLSRAPPRTQASADGRPNPHRGRLYFEGVGPSIGDDQLRAAFGHFGELELVEIFYHPQSRTSLQVGCVMFRDADAAANARIAAANKMLYVSGRFLPDLKLRDDPYGDLARQAYFSCVQPTPAPGFAAPAAAHDVCHGAAAAADADGHGGAAGRAAPPRRRRRAPGWPSKGVAGCALRDGGGRRRRRGKALHLRILAEHAYPS